MIRIECKIVVLTTVYNNTYSSRYNPSIYKKAVTMLIVIVSRNKVLILHPVCNHVHFTCC